MLAELAAVERMRAMLDAAPQSPLDAERTARTLSSLTTTLQRIQRMQAGLPATGNDNDEDLPPISMTSVTRLRAALRRSSQAGAGRERR